MPNGLSLSREWRSRALESAVRARAARRLRLLAGHAPIEEADSLHGTSASVSAITITLTRYLKSPDRKSVV